MKNPALSVIIAYYKNIPFLQLVLQGLEKQVAKNFEIIIAEDDNDEDFANFIQAYSAQKDFVVKHVSHENIGFRKNKIMNSAIKVATADFLVFIDADCIPHRYFTYQYEKNIVKGEVLYGRRVMISEKLTCQLLKENALRKLSFLALLFTNSTRVEDGMYFPFIHVKKVRGLLGCNWGVAKSDFGAVNGYDEDYENAGIGEDVDIEWRLMLNGLTLKSLKYKAIQYHIHHPSNYSSDVVKRNRKLMEEKQQKRLVFCANGLKRA